MTLVIMAIVIVITVPAVQMFSQKSTADILRSQLLRAIYLTRSTAMMQNTKALLCGSVNNQTCTDQWQDGFSVVVKGKVFYTFQHLAVEGMLHWRAFPLHRSLLEFLPSGFPNAENGTFWFCHAKTDHVVWAIMLNRSGRARVVYPDSQGNIIDAKGTALVC
ncbi:MAG: hypothetical protein ACD_45C00465G0003 [uncultured bacterium]|nr:MAG: hypothetical protein ACD_45C00465G0003 [uncultured bacterium]